jgi:hypothetical protein
MDIPFVENVSEEIANERLAICKQCPTYYPPFGTCLKCGCFMIVKVKLQSADCPENRWE